MKRIAIVACVHGNEPYGLEVGKNLPSSCSFFIANEKALRENKRFIDTDLNRCFPGKIDGNHEEYLAYQLTKNLKSFDYVIDLHSTPQNCEMFGILTKPNKEKMRLAKLLGLKRIVIMTQEYASGKALIDVVECGISLEIGPHQSNEISKQALAAINNLTEKREVENQVFEIYEVFCIIRGKISNVCMNNFQEVKKGQSIAVQEDGSQQKATFDFVPVLVGKKAYSDVICLACKKILFESYKAPFKVHIEHLISIL